MLQAYLVDDELHSLNMLEIFLVRTGKVNIAGRSANGFEAINALRHIRPHVWFLDIEMPGMTGLELAEKIHEVDPDAVIVFTTAYDQYAIAAFELAAIDYILKPIEFGRLSKTIERLSKDTAWRLSSEPSSNDPESFGELIVRMLGTFHVASINGKSMHWRTAKEKELFAYLLLHVKSPSALHRDQIIEQLWPDEPYEKAKTYLHTCVSLLRKNLRKIGIENIVAYEKEHYILDTDRISVDAHQFMSGLLGWHNSTDVSIAEMEQMLQLYQGELLASEDYFWAMELSQQLENTTVKWLLKLSKQYLAQENGKKAAEAAERASSQSPYDEEAYRLTMQAYLFMGKHDYVLRTYRQLEERLGELNIQPSAITRQLYEQIEI
ncbi:Two-component response regulator, SAPR family, consists of REC, wHTH and BTAD domains [Paenibacillus sp. 1_12]|uniref:response regulator n=1 Tax=Paenibacillus sp. 1_12 TaxID=1566278 RepID=UPI0008E04307|nr:response regulator [Paenibacillus sp. 1_12]SFL00878.1 Two-component response regulator, SAPR family, consists of REC, wHTH and BTAD domains [Paenibacillus sp. 1_12]